MKIYSFQWSEQILTHIGRHNVTREEVEEAAFDDPFLRIERGRSQTPSPVYYLLACTNSGRYLFIVTRHIKKGKAQVITARDMTDTEKTRYRRRL